MNAFINRIYKTITGYFEGGYCNNCNSEYTGSACPRCG